MREKEKEKKADSVLAAIGKRKKRKASRRGESCLSTSEENFFRTLGKKKGKRRE